MGESDFLIRIILEAVDRAAPTIARVNAEVAALKRTASGGAGREATPTSDLERGLKDTATAAGDAERSLKKEHQAVDQSTAAHRKQSASVREGTAEMSKAERAANASAAAQAKLKKQGDELLTSVKKLNTSIGEQHSLTDQQSSDARRLAQDLESLSRKYPALSDGARQYSAEAQKLGTMLSINQQKSRDQVSSLRALAKAHQAEVDATRKIISANQDSKQAIQDLETRYQSFRKSISAGEVTRKDAVRGMADFGRELKSVARSFDAGSDEAMRFGRMADQAIKQSKNDMPEAHGWLQKLVNATNDWGIKLISLSAALRGIGLALVVGSAQQLDTVLVGLVGSLISVASAASVAAAGIGGAFISAMSQTIPVIMVFVAAIERMKAVFNAVSEAQKLQQSQAVDAATSAKSQASAADALANAQANLKNSYGQLADAQGRVVQAQQALFDARRQAIRQIQDLVIAEKEAELAAAGASLSLVQAQQQLQQVILSGGTGTALAAAQLQVQEAQVGVTRAQTDLPRAAADARLAQQRGVSGAPGVVSAHQGLASARQGVASAQSQIAQNQRAVQQAAQSVATPTSSAQTAAKTLNYMLGQLDSAEKRLYTVLNKLRDLFQGPNTPLSRATDAIVNPFVNALDRVYKILSNPNNPITKGLNVLGASLGGAMQKFVDRTFSKDNMKFFSDMISEAARNLPKVINSFGNILDIISNIAEAAKPVIRFLVDGVDAWTKKIDASTSSQGGMSRLQRFFKESIPYIQSFIDLFQSFGHLFAAIVGQAAPAGKGIIEDLTNSINKATAWIDSHGPQVRDFFNQTARVLSNVGGLVFQIAKAMVGLFNPGTAKSFADFLTNVVLPVLSQALRILGFLTNAVEYLFGSPGVGFVLKWGATVLATVGIISKLFSGWFTMFGKLKSLWGSIFGKGGGPEAGAGIAGSMEEGGKLAGVTIADSMVAAGEKVSASISGAMAVGGTEAGAEISTAEVAGGAEAAAEISTVEVAGGVGAGAAGAGGAGILSRLGLGGGFAALGPQAVALAASSAIAGRAAKAITGSPGLRSTLPGFLGSAENAALGFVGLEGPDPKKNQGLASQFLQSAQGVDITTQSTAALKQLRTEAIKVSQLPDITANQRKGLGMLINQLDPANVAMKQAAKTWGDTFQGINTTTGNVMKQVQAVLKTDIQNISDNLGTGTVQGAAALAGSITTAYDVIDKNTTLAGNAVAKGLERINKMLLKELQSMGVSGSKVITQIDATPAQQEAWIKYQFTGGSGGTGPGARATGGYEQPKPGGKIIQVAEGGYPEVVLTTDPKYAKRQRGLLAKYLEEAPHVLGHASGGWVATAYGPPWGGIEGGGTTATGLSLPATPGQAPPPDRRYLIAVDPSVIPMHSNAKVWPNPFGYTGSFRAEDTGGAIKGRHIDIYDWLGRANQNAWGVRDVNVQVTGGPIQGTASATSGTSGAATVQQIKAPRMTKGLGVYTAIGQRALDDAAKAANQYLAKQSAMTSASTGGGPTTLVDFKGKPYGTIPAPMASQYRDPPSQGPSGLGNFQGYQVALWTIPMLAYAQQHGWGGSITSGYRGGLDPGTATGGAGEHSGTQYPHGAIDFGGPGPLNTPAGLNRAAFFAAASGFKGYQLIPEQFPPYGQYPQGDAGHASGTGHRLGGWISAASGFNGVVDRPTAFLTGEAGREHVSVTPMQQGGWASINYPQTLTGSGGAGRRVDSTGISQTLSGIISTLKELSSGTLFAAVSKIAPSGGWHLASRLAPLIRKIDEFTRQDGVLDQVSNTVTDYINAVTSRLQRAAFQVRGQTVVQTQSAAAQAQAQVSGLTQERGQLQREQRVVGRVQGDVIANLSNLLHVPRSRLRGYTPLMMTRALGRSGLKGSDLQTATQLVAQFNDLYGRANALRDQIDQNVSAQYQAEDTALTTSQAQVDQTATSRLNTLGRQSRIATVIAAGRQVLPGGQLAGVVAAQMQTGVLQQTGRVYQAQLSSYEQLLKRAEKIGDTTVINDLKDKIGELGTQIVENTQAISDQIVATRQATIDYINARASFQTGVLGALYGAVQTIGTLTGGLDVGTATSLTQANQNVLQGQQTGLLGQLSSGYGIDLQGLSGTSLIQALGGLNYSQIESGMTAAQQQQFEGLINSITGNVSALEQNTVQLQTLNGQLLGPQSFSTTAWQMFRSAIFTGMGGLLPQFASIPQMADGGEILRQGLAYLHPAEIVRPAKSSGGDQHFHIPVREGPVYAAYDPTEMARRMAWEAKSR